MSGPALLSLLVLLPQAGSERPSGADSVVGEVLAVRAADRRLEVRTDAGEVVVVSLTERAALLRTRPGATTLRDAVSLAFGDLAEGDRVLAQGRYGADGSGLQATRLVVMTRADLDAHRTQEREDWRRRGIGGVVAAVDRDRKELNVRLRSGAGSESLTVETEGHQVVFRRYAPDSVRFSDARPSSFDELEVGDQVRLLGERSADGTRYVPEQVVSGAFQTVRGVVASVDAAKGQLVLGETESGAKRPVQVAVGPDTMLRRLPPGFGLREAGRVPAESGETQDSGPRRRGTVDDLLERLPPISLADLRAGDAVAVLSTRGTDPSRLTAIKLVGGLPTTTAATGRGRRGGAGVDLGLPQGVLDLGGDVPW